MSEQDPTLPPDIRVRMYTWTSGWWWVPPRTWAVVWTAYGRCTWCHATMPVPDPPVTVDTGYPGGEMLHHTVRHCREGHWTVTTLYSVVPDPTEQSVREAVRYEAARQHLLTAEPALT